MASIETYNILDSIAGSSADVSVVNGSLKVTGAPSIPFNSISSASLVDPVVAMREVVVLSLLASTQIGQVYSIRIQQFVNGRNISKVFSYTSVTAADTRLLIATSLVRVISLDPELSVVATVTGAGGSETVTITASTGAPDITLTIISTGPSGGLTAATTIVDTTGTTVTAATTYTTATVSNVATYTRASGGQLTFASGMLVQITLRGAGDSITFRDGTVVSGVGATAVVRIGGTVTNGAAAGAFDVGITTDSRIAAISITTTTIAGDVVPVATPARGNAADLASRPIVGFNPSNIYSELVVKYSDISTSGYVTKEHSVFFNTGDADYATMRTTLQNLIGGSLPATAGTANPEAVAIG